MTQHPWEQPQHGPGRIGIAGGGTQHNSNASKMIPSSRCVRDMLWLAALCLAILRLPQPTIAQQSSISSALPPRIDYNALGRVAVVGQFDGLELYDPATSILQSAYPANNDAQLAATLFRLDTDGHLTRLVQTALGGSIQAVAQCASAPSIVYFGGNFSSSNGIGGIPTTVNNIAFFDASSKTVSALQQGVDGPVTALVCDDATRTLYVAGRFSSPIGVTAPANSRYLGVAAAWSVDRKEWSPMPFDGFPNQRGAIHIRSMVINSDSDGTKSLLYAGKFDTYWANTSTSAHNTSISVSVSNDDSGASPVLHQGNGTSIISNSVSVFPSLGSSLVPIPLASAEITASSSSSNPIYRTPQSLLCPAGADGDALSTWIGQDGMPGRITARLFTPLLISGFRVGNTLVEGDGTRTFSILALPNNIPLHLTYRTDPASPNSTTAVCSEACPLRHEVGTPYEDFLIAPTTTDNNTLTITGFEITLESYYGSAPGLHLLQLLSSGTVAFSQASQNNGYGAGLCTIGPFPSFGRSGSNAIPGRNLPWDPVSVTSSAVSGTQEGVLCGPVPITTDPDDAPTMTWYPYIAQDNAKYDVYFFTPACGFDSTCGQRAYVDVVITIAGTAGTETRTTTIYQEVAEDTYSLIYSGPIRPIASNEEVHVTMSLSRSRRATISPDRGNRYFLVADKVVVNASGSSNGDGSTQVKVGSGNTAVSVNSSTSTPVVQYMMGSGIWEFPLSDFAASSPFLDTTTAITQTIPAVQQARSLNRLSLGMSEWADVTSAMIGSDRTVFFAGNFTYSAGLATLSNIVAWSPDAQAFVSANEGLDGIVTSIAVANGWVYATGAFNRTADGSVTQLQGKARWQYGIAGASWQGISGISTFQPATTVSIIDRSLISFTYDRRNVDIWNPQDASVAAAGSFINGHFETAYQDVNQSSTFLAGTAYSYAQSAAYSVAMLTESGIKSTPRSLSRPTAQDVTKGSMVASTTVDEGPFAKWRNRNRNKRQDSSTSNATASKPVPLNDTLAVIVAAAFWHNTTSQDDVTIVGGSFAITGTTIRSLAVLTSSGKYHALPGTSDIVHVTALKVVVSQLWVAGSLSSSAANEVLRVYDLSKERWSDLPISVQSANGRAVVTSLTTLGDDVIVAGSFSSINAINDSRNVARYNTKDNTWTTLGQGLTGTVSCLSSTSNTVFAAGSFPQIAGNSSYASVWTLDNASWQSLPSSGLAGPGLSISADSETNAYMTGTVSGAGPATYVKRWDGRIWSDLGAPATGSGSIDLSRSSISQIQIVPVTDTIDSGSTPFIGHRRALLVSGQLLLANGQAASAAIYDGSMWQPFLMSISASGLPGTVVGFAYSNDLIRFSQNNDLARGLVILISVAIALGIVFLGVLVALIIALNFRSDDTQAYPITIPPYADLHGPEHPTTPLVCDEKMERSLPHGNLLETLDAAAAIAAGGSMAAVIGSTTQPSTNSSSRPLVMYASSTEDSETEGESASHGYDSPPLRAVRYSFEAEKPEEIDIGSGEMIEVLDDSDENWCLVKRLKDGKQGFVPHAFLEPSC